MLQATEFAFTTRCSVECRNPGDSNGDERKAECLNPKGAVWKTRKFIPNNRNGLTLLAPSQVSLIRRSDDEIAFDVEFGIVDTEVLFKFWVTPTLLSKWWPPWAEVDAKAGGDYHFWWPHQEWHLRGSFVEFDLGKRLSFTWKWDHDKDDRTLVGVSFRRNDKAQGGLTLTHSGHSAIPRSEEILQSHLDGWSFFLGKLVKEAIEV